MRLIDADALMKRMEKLAGCKYCDSHGGKRCDWCPWYDAMDLVYDAPDAEEENNETD